MKRMMLALVVISGLAIPASAHHSFAATYHEDQIQTVEGDLVQFLFRNPHSFVQLQGPDKGGAQQRWAVEWSGDHVIISGNPGRNAADHRLRMRSISRPSDGWKWSGTFE